MASISPGQVLTALLQNDRAKLAGLLQQAGASNVQELLARLEAETAKGGANANAVAAVRRLLQNKGVDAGRMTAPAAKGAGKEKGVAGAVHRQQTIAEARADQARGPMHHATRERPPTVAPGDDGGGLVVRLALLAVFVAFVLWVWNI